MGATTNRFRALAPTRRWRVNEAQRRETAGLTFYGDGHDGTHDSRDDERADGLRHECPVYFVFSDVGGFHAAGGHIQASRPDNGV